MDSRIYWIWLQRALPLGCTAMSDLLDAFGHAESIYRADEKTLLAAGVSREHSHRLTDKRLDTPRLILDRVLEAGDWVLTPEDARYPLALRHMPSCPATLYGRGVLPDLDSVPAVAVVGTRRANAAGLQEARCLAAGLAAGGVVVVSGGAMGIDAAVHAGALDGGGRTIVVMACSLNERYPVENEPLRQRALEQGSLLISEFPHGEPYRCDFPVRNRLLVGLSQAVCLAQTPTRSGARITARLAREHDRDVFAMPGSLTEHLYDGAHTEIQQGAVLVTRATDILRELAPRFPGMIDLEAADEAQKQVGQTAPPELSQKSKKRLSHKAKDMFKEKEKSQEKPVEPNESSPKATVTCPDAASESAKAVFALLRDAPQPVDELAGAAGLPIPALLVALTELEILGCAENCAGQQYKRP